MIHPFNILNYTTHHACALFDNGFALLWFCFGIIYFVLPWQRLNMWVLRLTYNLPILDVRHSDVVSAECVGDEHCMWSTECLTLIRLGLEYAKDLILSES